MKTAAVFSDNMVLQRGRNVRIFGTCDNEDTDIRVVVPELGVSAEAVISSGRWEALLPPMEACPCCTVEITSGDEHIVFRNTAIGEVWLAGGQSNMEYELQNDKNAAQALDECAGENVRFYYTPKCEMVDEKLFKSEEESGWALPSAENSKAWSAVGYYFAKELSRKLGVTVGILGCNWGGTSASAWMSREYLTQDSRISRYIEEFDEAVAGRTDEEMIKEYDDYLVYHCEWEKRMQQCYAERPDIGWNEILEICGENRYPGPPGIKNPMRPCGLYSTMISRVAPYTLAGVLWYQGESDEHRPGSYYTLMRSMIENWREVWHDDGLPFLIVQLPMFKYAEDADTMSWAVIREAQMKLFRTVRNTGLAAALDCGEFNNIHPIDKAPVGHRLCLQAMSEVYGLMDRSETLPPFFGDISRSDDSITVILKNCSGLEVKGSCEGDFELAGADGIYHAADRADISGDRITLSSSKVPVPVNVRYLWRNYAEVHIFGANGLPLLPFRTDRGEGQAAPSGTVQIRTTDGKSR